MIKPSSVSPDVESEVRFQAYISALSEGIGHADRIDPLRSYCTGLLLPGERKSIEPMAARLDPQHVQATHQSLHHFVAKAPWDDAAVLAAVREQVLPALIRHGPITAWILDDTGFSKKGTHSVGVARQYCGQLGKQDNCQVAVSLSLANDEGSLPVAFDLYLPEEWANDPVRRATAGVPKTLAFRTKPQIALEQIRRALAEGLPPGIVLGDAAYGIETDFRTALTALSLSYVLGVQSTLGVWPPGRGPLPPKPWSGTGRRPKLQRRDAEHHPEEWLLIEWPEGDKEPSKYWLSTLPATTALVDLVHMAKLRWRIERDYQDLKQELGLDHYEGRGWRGFHHHATLCIAVYGFLMAHRLKRNPGKKNAARSKAPALPEGYTPRGSGQDAAPRAGL